MYEIRATVHFHIRRDVSQQDVEKFITDAMHKHWLNLHHTDPFHSLKLSTLAVEFPVEGREVHVDI